MKSLIIQSSDRFIVNDESKIWRHLNVLESKSLCLTPKFLWFGF